jgi:glycosyltransferase involved in cell wall biosynthesis
MNHQLVDVNTAQSFLPKVSVVIPIYNSEADLPDLLSCLLSQTYPKEQVEYLLVDNNSSDRTLPILKRTAEDSPIAIRPLSENNIQSSYAARNTGIKAATGEIIAFTDADCRPESQWLNKLIQPFINSDVVIVAGEIVALPGTSLLEKFADKQEILSHKYTLTHKFYPYGQTANLAIRHHILTKSGLFRPYLTTGGDADICWRILKANLGKLEFVEDAIVKHRNRVTMKDLASQWQRYGLSNRYLHELHGIELTREIKRKEYIYILLRWLLKEVPKITINNIIGQASLEDLLNTPLGLFTSRERSLGQRKAKLPENARMIEWL